MQNRTTCARALVLAILVVAAPRAGEAQKLSNDAFQIEYDASGIRVLRRTNDIHDTNYVAPNGSLGPLLVRFKTTPNGDWRILRDLILDGEGSGGQQVRYLLGTAQPSLASRSSPSAAVGVAGLRGLNDGVVPVAATAGGRGAGPGSAPASADVPTFTWSGARGATQWVQYTFPAEEKVSRIEVFWTIPPKSWRLLYQESSQWKDVQARGAYPVNGGAFIPVEFEPVTTMALRVEVDVDPAGSVGMAEWRVGPAPSFAPSPDLAVTQTFALNADVLDWIIVVANNGSGPIEIGDLAVPFNFAERTAARGDIYTKKLLRHAYVAGHGSWVYWQRSNGAGPYLVLTPQGDAKFPSRNNDGATGGGFMPEPMGRAWIGKQMARGAWYYSAEEDVGYCGALRTHATIVARDPVFGELAYGGLLRRDGKRVSVVPRDGLRVRFHVVRDDQRLHLELDHDGFAKEQPIVVADDLSRVQFVLENRTGPAHETGLTLAGLPPGEYTLTVDGRTAGTIAGSDRATKIGIPVGRGATAQVVIARVR